MKDTHSAARLEEEEFVAATKELFHLSFERARCFYLEGQPTPAPQEARGWFVC
jgi:hypothetical protein